MILIEHKTYEEWLLWRDSGIGASEAGAVMGVSPWQTREELWALKSALMLPKPANAAMKRGLDLEATALDEYEVMTGVAVIRACAQHSTLPYVLATLDGLNVEQCRVVEVKCPGKADHAMALRGRIPDKYLWQCAQQLAVTGYPSLDYFSFDGEKGVIVKYYRNERWEARLLEELRLFWKSVVDGVPPGGIKTVSEAKPKNWDFPVRQNKAQVQTFQERLKNVIEFRGRK